jgi:replicative DNA helicase
MCSSILQPSYFDPELRNAVGFINQYYNDFHRTPANEQIKAEYDIDLVQREVTSDQIEYCAREVESFCKQRAIAQAVLMAASKINDDGVGEIEGLIRDALNVSLQRNLGLDYSLDPLQRLQAMKDSNRMVSTGWKSVDDILGGGVNRGELLLWSANSGGGKSLVMGNYGLNFLERGMNVLYISFELSEGLIAKRYDSMVTGINQVEILPRMSEVAAKVQEHSTDAGKLTIKQMSAGTRPMEIRAYLKEFELTNGYVPDLLIFDYLDLLSPNEKVGADNVFEKDKLVAEQIRDILVTYDVFGTSASQQNRSAVEATELNHSHIAGGISKINTTDNYISIIMSNQMRAQGEMMFQFLKTRSSDGVGKQVTMGFNSNSLRVSDQLKEGQELTFTSRAQAVKEPTEAAPAGGKDLLDMFDM